MFVLMRCLHKPGADAERDALRPTHRDWNKSGGEGLVSVITGSALRAPDGTAIGHWGILEAESLDKARAYIDGDPFTRSGIVTDIELTRMADGFAADRINPRITG